MMLRSAAPLFLCLIFLNVFKCDPQDVHVRYCKLNDTDYLKPIHYVKQITQSANTLDVFTIVAKPYEYSYIANGEFWLNFKDMRIQPAYDNEGHMLPNNHKNLLRFHIFSDTDWILDQGKEQGYHMYDMRNMTDIDKKFRAIYKHHAVNEVEYEFLCFYRWHLFRYAIDNWADHAHPIENIITMDSDIIMLSNAFEYYFKTLETLQYRSSNQFELIVVSPGKSELVLISRSCVLLQKLWCHMWWKRHPIYLRNRFVATFIHFYHRHNEI